MDKFIKANSLRMSSLLPLCAVSSPKHCAMHIALEELFYMDGTDVLVVGTGECAYYSRKNLFPNGRLNWAYELSDREVVFGDIGGVETALRMMAESGRKVVCISTCIPSLTGLDLVSLCDKTGAVYLSAADYERIDPSDILEDLYSVLFAGFPAGSQGGKSVWRGTPASISAAADLLKAEKHIICERKYRKMLSEKAKTYNIHIFDDTCFHPLADYADACTELDISGEEMLEMERLAEDLRGSRWNIRSARALSLASFLRSCGAECSFLIQAGFTRTEYEICRTLGETQICINAAEALPSADDVKTLDLVDEENKKRGAVRIQGTSAFAPKDGRIMPLKKLFCLPSARSAMYYCAVQFKDLAILDRSTFGHALYNYGHLTRLATRFEGSNAFSTHLTQAEIIFGDDSRFFNAVGELAERGSYHGVFVLPNVIGGVLGKDLSAMAEEAEKKFNLPVFTVDAHQDANFMDGQQLFYMNMFKKMADSNQLKKEYTYNLLCAGPFDCFAAADAAYIKKLLYKKLGLVCNFDLSQVMSVWDWKDFGRAGLNIVCSDAGVKLAVEAQQQCGIPYLRFYPLGENMESDGLSEIAAFFGIPFRTRQDARFAEVCREFGNILSVFKTKIICFATADKLRALRSFLQLFDVDAEYWCPYFTTGFKTVNEDECLSFCKGNDVLFIGFDRLAKQFSHAISLEKSGLDYHLQIPFRIPFVGKTGAYRLMQMIVDGLI